MKKVVLLLTIVGLGSLWIVPNVFSANNKPQKSACYLMTNTGGAWNNCPLVVTTKLSGNRVRDEKGTVKFYSIDAIIKSTGPPYPTYHFAGSGIWLAYSKSLRGSITGAIGAGDGMGCSLWIPATGSKYARCYSIGFTDPDPNYDLQEIECRSLDLDEWDSATATD